VPAWTCMQGHNHTYKSCCCIPCIKVLVSGKVQATVSARCMLHHGCVCVTLLIIQHPHRHLCSTAAASDTCCSGCTGLLPILLLTIRNAAAESACYSCCPIELSPAPNTARHRTKLNQHLPELELVQRFIELPTGMLGIQRLEV
jgi:hypothetical protein